MTTTTIAAQADAWRDFASGRCRFDVEKKAAQSLDFSVHNRAHSFVLPTKLVGTKRYQHCLEVVRDTAPDLARLDVLEEGGEILICWDGWIMGRVQSKHVRWLGPLLVTRRIRIHLLMITGGREDAPTLGVNIALAGIHEALEAFERGYGWRVREKVAA